MSNAKPKSPQTQTETDPTPDIDLVQRHLGIITQHCLVWWPKLPSEARIAYSLEDMIGEVTLHIIAQTPKYNSQRSRESTWVWSVVLNQCRSILSRYYQKRNRSCLTVELTAWHEEVLPEKTDPLRYVTALNAVERMIELGSDCVLDFIERLLDGSQVRERQKVNQRTLQEFRETAERCSATYEDFCIVLRRTLC